MSSGFLSILAHTSIHSREEDKQDLKGLILLHATRSWKEDVTVIISSIAKARTLFAFALCTVTDSCGLGVNKVLGNKDLYLANLLLVMSG